MAYRAKILCHSVGEDRPDLSLMSVEVEFPRIVLAECCTHRLLSDEQGVTEFSFSERTTTRDMSKNSASSRAIPIKRFIDKVMEDPYVPERFTKNGPGMQGHGYLGGEDHARAVAQWLKARDEAAFRVKMLDDMGVHKQDANRLLEPFMWVTQVITADAHGWNNFFALRCHPDSAPALQKVARMVYLLYRESVPDVLKEGEWHLPYVKPEEKAGFVWHPMDNPPREKMELPDLIQFSAARCAWVSYTQQDAIRSPERMKSTFQKLMGGDVKHASPCEHQATPRTSLAPEPWFVSNFRGWIQARKLIAGEKVTRYNPTDEEVASWGLA